MRSPSRTEHSRFEVLLLGNDNADGPNHDHVIRLKVSWFAYDILVDELGDDRRARLTYDGEILEIMSPGSRHERIANLIADMLAFVTAEWSIDLTNFGSTTFQTKPLGGFEADKAYYLDARSRIQDVERIHLTIDPPPDLVIDVDIASSSSNRLVSHAALGVPDVWRFTSGSFSMLALIGSRFTGDRGRPPHPTQR